MNEELVKAAEEQQKFQYYVTALVFTFLAAAMHGARTDDYGYWSLGFEVLGWLSLLAAGLLSLLYLEGRGRNMRHSGLLELVPRNDPNRKTIIQEEEAKIEKSRAWLNKAYDVGRVSIAIGVFSIVLARIIHGFSQVMV